MVAKDPNIDGHNIVTVIIDWELSGFHSKYFECTTLPNAPRGRSEWNRLTKTFADDRTTL
ncbi:hypothetical protein N7495_006360 [Penicillium taxi]|uniref:uncharacterized protein n=1 Tax=Penicillium taxi TaxID=168475 RepID=UPI00254518DB|nr:uncharacterized protein N7495_006360 [Penicillium taxi]KAJ5894669.1 hypothetical protein N7495_006360 [Penicillium taxi]